MSTAPASALIAIRLGVAVGVWGLPGPLGRLMGVDLRGNPEGLFYARILGSKEVGMVVCTLASAGKSRRLWWQFGAACDLADFGASVLGVSEGGPKRFLIMSGATALAAAGLGVAAMSSER